MKRKVLLGIAAAALAAVMCVGFSGCGGVNAESVRGEKVTETQWNSAIEYFSKDDATYVMECSEEYVEARKCEYIDEILSGEATGVETTKVVKNGAKEYVKEAKKIELSGDYKKFAAALDQKIEELDEVEETYAEKNGNNFTVYYRDDDDKWASQSASSSIAYRQITDKLMMIISGVLLSYGSYEYSNDLKGYVPKDSLNRDAVHVVKFNGDGKLCAINFESETVTKSGNREHTMKKVFNIVFDYDAEEITLPTVA